MKLVVYIPTYNRASGLTQQLRTLQSYSGDDELVVIVQDNCSTQAEYHDVQAFCKEVNFIYIRNVCNIGGNPNIVAGFLHSNRADYLWILSDDDLLKPTAVNRVFNLLHKYQGCDLLYLTHGDIEPEEYQSFDQSQMLFHINDGLGLISQVIYRSAYIAPYIRAGYDNLITCFPHLAVLFESVRNEGNINVCRISKADFFLPEEPQPPSESIGYVYSFYGFTLLANNLHEELRKSFLSSWWTVSRLQAAQQESLAPLQATACFAILKKHVGLFSLQLLIVKIFIPFYRLRNFLTKAVKLYSGGK